ALDAAVRLRQKEISGGHLLIGVIDQGDNGALGLLAAFAVDTPGLRADVGSRLAGAARAASAPIGAGSGGDAEARGVPHGGGGGGAGGAAEYQSREQERWWFGGWLPRPPAKFDVGRADPARKFYNLVEFPYPSAEGLHVGHVYTYCGADALGRYMTMNGRQVL